MRKLVSIMMVTIGAFVGSCGSWIYIKAFVAQRLLQRSWTATLHDGEVHRPWPWADTSPVARIEFVDQKARAIVLDGASGRNLAFAPGWLQGTAKPCAQGATVIAGHRDTHFEILAELRPGDEVVVDAGDGRQRSYRVAGCDVVHESDSEAITSRGGYELILVTCWPFSGLGGTGDRRYVVRCISDGETPQHERSRRPRRVTHAPL